MRLVGFASVGLVCPGLVCPGLMCVGLVCVGMLEYRSDAHRVAEVAWWTDVRGVA